MYYDDMLGVIILEKRKTSVDLRSWACLDVLMSRGLCLKFQHNREMVMIETLRYGSNGQHRSIVVAPLRS